MDKDIKTRRVVRNIKTAARRTGAVNATRAAAIKTREAAYSTIPAVSHEQDRMGEDESTEDEEIATRGVKASAGTLRANRAHVHAKKSQAEKTATGAATKGNPEANPAPPFAGATASAPPGAPPDTPARATPDSRKAPKANSRRQKAAATQRSRTKPGRKPSSLAATPTNPLKARVQKGTRLPQPKAAGGVQKAAKTTADGARSFAQIAAAAARSLSSAMIALGGTAISAIVAVCLAALVAASAFGIFFGGGDMGDGNPSLRECVSHLNADRSARIEAIKADNPHDKVTLTGSKAPWKEVLAVFAVKTTTDAGNPLDVITMDETRQKLLESVFWRMNSISSRVEEEKNIEIVLEEDPDGNPVETTKTTTERVLYIELSHISSDEAASVCGFGAPQLDILRQLLEEKNDLLWQAMLYDINRSSNDIVEAAASQIGNSGGQPYWSWYGFGSRVEWCACFVSWCADQCGYIESEAIPKFAYCPTGVQWFKDAGRWQDRGYAPQPGDIIFFDWQGDDESDHVGIVESCDGTTVFAIEGNSGDAYQRNSYDIRSASIIGYGTLLH